MFITSKNKYLSNDMKIFGTCSIPLTCEHKSINGRGIKTKLFKKGGHTIFKGSKKVSSISSRCKQGKELV